MANDGGGTKKGAAKTSEGRRPLAVTSPYPWTVTEQLVRHFSDQQLRDLIRELLVAEAYRRGGDVSKVIANAELKAKDKGADAQTPPANGAWLGERETCWQLKAGDAGQPSKLKGEITKDIPAQVLRDGGRFVLVVSGAAGGTKAIKDRKVVLVAEAQAVGLPTDHIEVFTAEILTTWINEHPAIAATLRGLPAGYTTLEHWLHQRPHSDPWVSSAELDRKIQSVREAIAFAEDSAGVHLHVFGRPGIGKSRFVLQACVEAGWKESVLYVAQWGDADVAGMLTSVASANVGRLVLVVDEVPLDKVRGLSSYAQNSDKIRLITIGHHASPDAENISGIEVTALDDMTMSRLIEAAHPTMPQEQVRYVVAFANGYTRLARLAAHAVATNPTIDTRELLLRGDIRQLMTSMLGAGDRRPLHVLAVLSTVGWSGRREEEGQAIAAHFGLEWRYVQAGVVQFQERDGIAPRANDLRYISPAPLGVFLALEAIEMHGELYWTLYDALPNDQARRAYNERLSAIIAHPFAKNFGEEELGRFFLWSHFTEARAVERWVTLSAANPAMAAARARTALQSASNAERTEIKGRARSALVRGLVRIAAHAAAFHDAALALAELSAAENETWSNNASGEFVARFQLHLGGTAAPYSDRLGVLEDLLATNRPALMSLAVRALLPAIGNHEFGDFDVETGNSPAPTSWEPRDEKEELQAVGLAFDMLDRAASFQVPDETLVEAADSMSMLLRIAEIRDSAARFMRTVVTVHPETRERIRRVVRAVAQNSRRFWKERDEQDIRWIEALEREFSDASAAGRFRELVGQPDFDRTPESLRDVASEAFQNPTLLWSQWSWLTSGEAGGAWQLGVAIAQADPQGSLLELFKQQPTTGADFQFVAGYLRERLKQMPALWLEDWLDAVEDQHPVIAFDVTARIGDTSRGAERLTRLLRAGQLPSEAAARLAFGPWALGPDIQALRVFIEELLTAEPNRLPLLHLIDNRIQQNPGDLTALEHSALLVVTNPAVLVADSMSQYHWDLLARALLPKYVREVVRTIFRAQRKSEGSHFFLHHSKAANTLDACIAASAEVVWDELAGMLTPDLDGERFIIGFPQHVLERLPRQQVLDWIAESPTSRAPLVARITAQSFSDSSLAAAILDRWGNEQAVRNRSFGALVTGSWSGDASTHWNEVALRMDQVARETKLTGLRDWAKQSAFDLRKMVEHDVGREAEERVRDFSEE